MSLLKLRRALARSHVIEWYRKERAYADVKYPVSTVEQFGGMLRQEDIDFVMQYLRRAQVLGLGTPQGRQQLAKAAATLMHFTEGVVVLYGPLPAPGVASGEVAAWAGAPPLSHWFESPGSGALGHYERQDPKPLG